MFKNLYQALSASVLSEIALSVLLIIVFTLTRKVAKKVVSKRALLHEFDPRRILYIRSTVAIGLWILFFVGLAMIWNISFKGLSIYVASIFTVIGVALFANWSMLSNITASVILFFFFPFKVGSKVKIIDGDNSIEGLVVALSLFSVHIQRADETDVFVPNNLAIQKSIVHLSED